MKHIAKNWLLYIFIFSPLLLAGIYALVIATPTPVDPLGSQGGSPVSTDGQGTVSVNTVSSSFSSSTTDSSPSNGPKLGNDSTSEGEGDPHQSSDDED